MTLITWSIIENNTVSEADTKKKINEIKKTEVKGERLINSQKILLSLFDYLVKAIFNNSNISNNNNNSNNNNENESKNENENENDDESVNDNERENENESESESENDVDDITVKEINNNFKKINETKSFEDQINILKKNTRPRWLLGY